MEDLASEVDGIFQNWLVNKLYSMDSDLHADDDYQKQVAYNKMQRNEKTQRLLLDVEVDQAKERESKKQNSREFKNKLANVLKTHAIKVANKYLYKEKSLFEALRYHKGIEDMYAVLYSPSSTLAQIASAIENVGQGKMMIDLVTNREFCKSIGKPQKDIKSVSAACGYMGIELVKVIVPMMRIKDLLKFRNFTYPLFDDKLWNYIVCMGNTLYYIMEREGFKEPKAAWLVAAMSAAGYVAVYKSVDQIFDDAREGVLTYFREKNLMKQYFAATDIEADYDLFVQLLKQFKAHTNQTLFRSVSWNYLAPIGRGLEQHHADMPFAKRCDAGKWILQAKTFAQFDLMRKYKVLPKEKMVPLFQFLEMDVAEVKMMATRNFRKLDLTKFT